MDKSESAIGNIAFAIRLSLFQDSFPWIQQRVVKVQLMSEGSKQNAFDLIEAIVEEGEGEVDNMEVLEEELELFYDGLEVLEEEEEKN